VRNHGTIRCFTDRSQGFDDVEPLQRHTGGNHLEFHCGFAKDRCVAHRLRLVFWSPDIGRARLLPLPVSDARCAAWVTMNSLQAGLLGAIYTNDRDYALTPSASVLLRRRFRWIATKTPMDEFPTRLRMELPGLATAQLEY